MIGGMKVEGRQEHKRIKDMEDDPLIDIGDAGKTDYLIYLNDIEEMLDATTSSLYGDADTERITIAHESLGRTIEIDA